MPRSFSEKLLAVLRRNDEILLCSSVTDREDCSDITDYWETAVSAAAA